VLFRSDKISEVRREAMKRSLTPDIEVDGGINGDTAYECAKQGANVFVAGSFIFKSPDYAASIKIIRESALRGAAEIDNNNK
jgi:ribulose-phosphate 3-epimerase